MKKQLLIIGILHHAIKEKKYNREELLEVLLDEGVNVSISTVEKYLKRMRDIGAPIVAVQQRHISVNCYVGALKYYYKYDYPFELYEFFNYNEPQPPRHQTEWLSPYTI